MSNWKISTVRENRAKLASHSCSLSVKLFVLLELTWVSGKHKWSHNPTCCRTVTFPGTLLICSFPLLSTLGFCYAVTCHCLIYVRLVTQKQAVLQFVLNGSNLNLRALSYKKFLHTHWLLLQSIQHSQLTSIQNKQKEQLILVLINC